MSAPTPAEVHRTEEVRGLIASEGPCGDAPLDDALAELSRARVSFEEKKVNADAVLSAAQALHDRIQARLEEAR